MVAIVGAVGHAVLAL